LLPDLLAADKKREQADPSLLLVGEVAYGADPGAPTESTKARTAPRGRAGSLGHWDELPNTAEEIAAVGTSFELRFPGTTAKILHVDEPTEDQIRKFAPAYQYLHFATHGFFAPPELRSALAATSRSGDALGRELITRQDLAGFHPGLLSGIVLAGANQDVTPEKDDGILTTLEVAGLDLGRVEVATLSACETGLGETAGGEGLLGLQRAFQTAGAHSVVASLWKVNDDAARQLMIDFYDNLWTKKMPKVEALRQAQLTMLREGVKPGTPLAQKDRSLKNLDKPAPDADNRLGPALWAAFELSGDWR
jgi:CHAT domain-containing protein